MANIFLVRPNIGQPLIFNTWPESFKITVAGKDFAEPPTRDTLAYILPSMEIRLADRDVWLPLKIINILEPVLYALADGTPDESSPYFFQHHAGFEWEISIVVKAEWPDHLPTPTMWNIKFGEETNYHAVYIGPMPTEYSRFLHLTDTHISGRNDIMHEFFCYTAYEEPWRKKEFSARNMNPNDNLRAIVKYANEKADAGEIDFVVLTGDIVDYIYDGYWDFGEGEYHYGYPPKAGMYNNPMHRCNFDVFIKIIAGLDYKSDRLKIPIFIVPGNHDYLAYEPLLAFDIDIDIPADIVFKRLGIFGFLEFVFPINLIIYEYAQSLASGLIPPEYQGKVDRYSRPRLSLREALMFDRWKQGQPYEPSDVAQPTIELGNAINLWLTPNIQMFALEYLTKISYDTDFVFQVPSDGHQFVCLNSGWDIGVASKRKLIEYAMGDVDLTRFEELAFNDHPRNSGFRPIHKELMTEALNKAGSDYSVILFHHAPILSEEVDSGPDEPHEVFERSAISEYLERLPEAAMCDYDTALGFTKLIDLPDWPFDISFAGHTHKATEHQLTLNKETDGKTFTVKMWSDRYSTWIDPNTGFQLEGRYPLLFQSGSLVSPRPMIREVELKANRLTKALMQNVPMSFQALPVGTMAPFLSAAVVRFSRLHYKGDLNNPCEHQRMFENAANWDTELIFAEINSHLQNVLYVVDFYYTNKNFWWSDMYIDAGLLEKNLSELLTRLHDLWNRLQIPTKVGWYDIYRKDLLPWPTSSSKIVSMVEEAFGFRWLQVLCGLENIHYPLPNGDADNEWNFWSTFRLGGLTCIGITLWLNRFGVTGDSRIYPIDQEKNELYEDFFYQMVSHTYRVGRISDLTFDYYGYIAERLVKVFSFAEENLKHPLCLWYTLESTYLAEEGGFSNTSWNNLDPAYHLGLARNMSKANMVKELVSKYYLQFQRQGDTAGIEGVRQFYARSGVRLNSWAGCHPIDDASFIGMFTDVQTAEEALIEKVKYIADKLMPCPPPPPFPDPDVYEPNDTFDQAKEVNLTVDPRPTLLLDQLTLHVPEDKDIFLITYPEIEEESPFGAVDSEWFVMRGNNAYLLIRALEDKEYIDQIRKSQGADIFETSFTFALHDLQKTEEKIRAERTHKSCVEKPTALFPERRLYLQVTNPDQIQLPYELEITFVKPSISVQIKKPLTEERWFELPWDPIVFENPADIVEQFINHIRVESLDLTVTEKKNMAAFQNELGLLAESSDLFDKAENLYSASSSRYEEIDDTFNAIKVLRNLTSLYTKLGYTEKVKNIRNRITSLIKQSIGFYLVFGLLIGGVFGMVLGAATGNTMLGIVFGAAGGLAIGHATRTFLWERQKRR